MPQSLLNCGNESTIPVNKTKDLGNERGRTSLDTRYSDAMRCDALRFDSIIRFASLYHYWPTSKARQRRGTNQTLGQRELATVAHLHAHAHAHAASSKLYIKHMSPVTSLHTNEGERERERGGDGIRKGNGNGSGSGNGSGGAGNQWATSRHAQGTNQYLKQGAVRAPSRISYFAYLS